MSSTVKTRSKSQLPRKTEMHQVPATNSKTRKNAEDSENAHSSKATSRSSRRDQKLTDLTNQDNVSSVPVGRKSRSRVRTVSNRDKHRNQSKSLEDVERKLIRIQVGSKTKKNDVELKDCSVNLQDISIPHSYFEADKNKVSKIVKKPLLKESQEDSLITRMIKKRKTTKESKNANNNTVADQIPSTIKDTTALEMRPSRLRKPTPYFAEYSKQIQSRKRNLKPSQESTQKACNENSDSSVLLNTTRTRSLSPQPLEKTASKVTLRSKSRPVLRRNNIDLKDCSVNLEDILDVPLTNTVKERRGRPKKYQDVTETPQTSKPQESLESSVLKSVRTGSESVFIENRNEVSVKIRSKSRADINRTPKNIQAEIAVSSTKSKRGRTRKNLKDSQQEELNVDDPSNQSKKTEIEKSTKQAQPEIKSSIRKGRGRSKTIKAPETITSSAPQNKLEESTRSQAKKSPKLRDFSIILNKTSDIDLERRQTPISAKNKIRPQKDKITESEKQKEPTNSARKDLKVTENVESSVQESSEFPISNSIKGKRGRPQKKKGSDLIEEGKPSKNTSNVQSHESKLQESSKVPVTNKKMRSRKNIVHLEDSDLDIQDFSENLVVDSEKQQKVPDKPQNSKQIQSAGKTKAKETSTVPETSKNQSRDLLKKPSLVRESMKRRLSSDKFEPGVKPALKKRDVIQSPPKSSLQDRIQFKKLIEVEEDDAVEDVYNFRMSQAVYPKNMKRKKAQPVRRNKKKTNAGNKIDNLIQQNNLNIVSNSCAVMHNPGLFKAEKAKVMQSLQPNPKHIPKINIEVDIAKEIKIPQRKSLNQSVNTTKSRTPPKNLHRRLNMSSPDPDMNNDNILPELPAVSNNLEVPVNPIVNKIVQNTKRASLVFSPKIVSSPKIVNSPFRINDEIKFPRTFYFSLTKDNLPSFSSDHVMKDLEGNQKADKTQEEASKVSDNLQKSTESSRSSDYFTPPQIVEGSVLNNSDMENIAPPQPSKKTPKKKGLLENPTRSPLKALDISVNVGDNTSVMSHVQSPLAVYSTTVDQRKNVVILENELLKEAKPGPSKAYSKTSNITEDLSDQENSVRVPAEIPKNYSSSLLEENSTNNENLENRKINSKTFNKRSEMPSTSKQKSPDSSDVEDDFGFDDLINESVHEETEKDPRADLSFSAIKQKLSNLKQYLPSKQKNTSNEKITVPSPVKATKVFTSPKKISKDIREMFTSTPHQGEGLLKKKKISFDVESTRRSNLLSTTEATVANDETQKEREVTETSTQIELFDDPNLTTDASQIYRSYTRKRRFDFLDVTDGNISDLEDEEAERPKKKKRKPNNVENTKEFKNFVSEMNSAFEEVDNYEMVVE